MEPRPLTASQQLVSDLADLCRARPAVWSRVIHRADQLAAPAPGHAGRSRGRRRAHDGRVEPTVRGEAGAMGTVRAGSDRDGCLSHPS